MAKILLVEDEQNIASFIKRGLEESGYNVTVASDGISGCKMALESHYHLLILDIIMPGMNGLELCESFRRKFGYKVPVIMLTALGTTDDIVNGLEAGADDYLVKPFSFQELEARIKALLRREKGEETSPKLTYADLSLDYANRKAYRDQKEIELTSKEFRLLEYFMNNPGKILSRMTLLKNVWDRDFDTNTNVVDVYVNYIRGKIDKDFKHKLIHTVVGLGYMMNM